MAKHVQTDFVVFHGELTGGPLCGLVDGARRANALDLVERAAGSGAFSSTTVYTDSDALAKQAAGVAGKVVRTYSHDFHFGKAISDVVSASSAQRICYFGSGAGALLSADEIARLASAESDREVVANNLYSTDFCAFTRVEIICDLALPATDNGLSRVLVEQGRFSGRETDRRPAAVFDIDAPLDLSALQLSAAAKGRLPEYVERHAPTVPHIEAAMHHFTNRDSEVMVAGRVSADTHLYLDRETACRVRFLAEERGIAAAGAQGARSIVGMWIAHQGPAQAFGTLKGRTHAAFIDSRLLFAHEKIEVPMEERFAADLYLAKRLETPYVRALVQAAGAAPFPVVLGSHSLLNGGIMLLCEAAWREAGQGAADVRGLRTAGPKSVPPQCKEAAADDRTPGEQVPRPVRGGHASGPGRGGSKARRSRD
ncbi:MAG: hypothetical protein HY897_05955 [Deltaproteobacteria bacterium]|nr:hypothetical protein [Deltaproteobacteria bacterium]